MLRKEELIKQLYHCFISRYKNLPFIISSPGRINIIGEHTDYNSGYVLPAAINKYIFAAIAENSTKKQCRVYSMDMEEEIVFDLDILGNTGKGNWTNYVLGAVNEVLKIKTNLSGFDMVLLGNIPLGAGLSSSAALENSIIYALDTLFRLSIEKKRMALMAQAVEHNYIGVECGIMDQLSGLMGENGKLISLDCKNLETEMIDLKLVNHEFCLINSNIKHQLNDSPYNDRKTDCETGINVLKRKYAYLESLRDTTISQLESEKSKLPERVYRRCRYVIEENERVLNAVKSIKRNDFNELGSLLFQSHRGLRDLYEVSCKELDFIVEEAMTNENILGARMMGAGFGGCVILLTKKDYGEKFFNSFVNNYKKEFNVMPEFYNIEIVNGVTVIDSNIYKEKWLG